MPHMSSKTSVLLVFTCLLRQRPLSFYMSSKTSVLLVFTFWEPNFVYLFHTCDGHWG